MAHDKCWHRFYKMFNADNKKTSWTFNHIEGVYTPMEKVDD
jgi:hypothetical protein